MKARVFEDHWKSLAASFLHGLEPRELEAARQIFYAGGAVAFGFITDRAAMMPEAAACQAMDAMADEFSSFIAEMTESEMKTEH